MNNEISVIILAGGQGTRVGSSGPKQFIRIAGKPILAHTYEAIRAQLPDAIIVIVTPVDAMNQAASILPSEPNIMIVAGGASRQSSTYEGLKALKHVSPKNVLIHDAARPFVSGQIIHNVLMELKRHEAVDVAISTSDTIIVERNGFIQNIPERKHILRGQTPQAFRYAELVSCYEDIGEDRLDQFTDDCGIYLHSNPLGKVRIVPGSEENFKITNPIDLILADEMFRLRQSEFNIDQPGINVKGKRALIFGGTSGIGKAMAEIMLDAGAEVICRGRRNGCDVRDIESIKNSFDHACKIMGGIDIVVNAVGFLQKGKITELSDTDINNLISINLNAALWIAKLSHKPLSESKGSLLQFASSSYTRGRSEYVIYSATKAAIVNMTQGLSEEWASDGINVNCIVPGRTDTNMRRINFTNEKQNSLFNPYEIALGATKLLSTKGTGLILRIN
jgi:2-C-methyl-D-erythritol 4-phosphate cytidylyltransferase